VVTLSDRGVRLALLGTQLDNETATLTRLARDRAKLVRELRTLDLRITETVRVIGVTSDKIRHEGGV
jgi:hypothetical protein